MSNYMQWLKCYISCNDRDHKIVELCPECNGLELQQLLIGDVLSRQGYGFFWCDSCKTGIRLCRIKVPEKSTMISFEEANDIELPYFKCVEPK